MGQMSSKDVSECKENKTVFAMCMAFIFILTLCTAAVLAEAIFNGTTFLYPLAAIFMVVIGVLIYTMDTDV